MADAKDPRVTSTHGHAPDATGPAPGPIERHSGQHTSYWILTDEERAKGYVRPVRFVYWHRVCRTTTRMARAIAETYARDPSFYTATFCVACRAHLPVGDDGEFFWLDAEQMPTQERVGGSFPPDDAKVS